MQAAWNDKDETGKFEPNKPAAYWLPVLWVSAGFLWSVWLMQNAANIAVYLPRQLNWWQFILFCSPIVGGLAVVMRMGGDKVQEVVEEKSGVGDIRSAAVINIVYGGILFFFQNVSNVPMSTTWVFVGLLAGRELALCQKGISGATLKVRPLTCERPHPDAPRSHPFTSSQCLSVLVQQTITVTRSGLTNIAGDRDAVCAGRCVRHARFCGVGRDCGGQQPGRRESNFWLLRRRKWLSLTGSRKMPRSPPPLFMRCAVDADMSFVENRVHRTCFCF